VISSKTDNLAEKREALKLLLKNVDKKYRASVYQGLLINGYEQALYDYETFEAYLDKPVAYSPYFSDSTNKRQSSHDYYSLTLIQYQPNVATPPTIDQVIEAHLRHFVKSDKLYKNLAKYFKKEYLTEILATNKALDGGSIKDLRETCGDAKANELENRVVLDFAVSTKRQFKRGEEVAVYLTVKNIQKLTCKLFELDTVQYYLAHDKELDDTIDLDGLRPENTLEFRFGYPKQQQFIHKVVFDQVKKKDQGIFIAEFLGGSTSCRMIIRKGTLQLLPFAHHLGVAYKVIDERRAVCAGEGTGVLVDGKFHQADDEGRIVFPFNDVPIDSKRVIAIHKGFSCFTELSLPKEAYTLKSALIFNEEGVVRDQINTLVIRNKLYLNSTPITLRKAETCDVVVELKNFQDVSNMREYKNQTLDDAADIEIELPTLKLTSLIRVTVVMKFKDLRGAEVVLKSAKEISIDRNNKEDKFCTVHLKTQVDRQTKQKSLVLELLGKNGEPIPHHRLQVEFLKSFGMYDYQSFVHTDDSGLARLGNIHDTKYITVDCPQKLFKKRLFVMPDPYQDIDIPQMIELCFGEKLLLPALGKKLSRESFELIKVGPNPYNMSQELVLADCFDNLKVEVDAVAADQLPKGEYIFTYNLVPSREVRIVVHDGERWERNPYILQKPRSILQLKAESRYLALTRLKQTDQGIALSFSSNNQATVRAHVLCYQYEPTHSNLLRQQLLETNPTFTSELTPLKFVTSSMLSNRQLSDELAYVQRRKAKEQMVGNTLAKPSILLHREKVRETTEDAEVLRAGKGFDADRNKEIVAAEAKVREMKRMSSEASIQLNMQAKMMDDIQNEEDCEETIDQLRGGFMPESIACDQAAFFKKSKKKGGGIWSGIASIFTSKEEKVFEGVDWNSKKTFAIRRQKEEQVFKIYNNLDFALNTGKVIANLRPNQAGEILIDKRLTAGSNLLQIVLSDANSTLLATAQLQSTAVSSRDLRVAQVMQPGVIWTESYTVVETEPKEGGFSVDLRKLSNVQSIFLQDVESLFSALTIIVGPKVDLISLLQWNFLGSWAKYSLDEKFEKWEKFGGTELSVFLYFRDHEFWLKFIMPLLLCKAQLSLEDLILLALATGEKRFADQLPEWEAFSGLSPLALLLMSIFDRRHLAGCIELVEGRCLPAAFDDVKKAAESILSQIKSANREELIDCKQPDPGNMGGEMPTSMMQPGSLQGFLSMDQERGMLDSSILDRSQERSKKDKKEKSKKRDKDSNLISVEEEDIELEAVDGLIQIDETLTATAKVLEEYKKAPQAVEFKERQEYFKGETAGLRCTRFWLQLLKNLQARPDAAGESATEWFAASEDILLMKASAVEVLMAVTFSKVPLARGKILSQEQSSESVAVTSTDRLLALVKSIQSLTPTNSPDSDLVISQKFYDPTDKFIYDVKDTSLYTLKEIDEFLTAKIYESRIGITNLAETLLNVQLVIQIPEGSLPVSNLEDFKFETKRLAPMSTEFVTFKFYFPSVGAFSYYPATLAKGDRLIAFAKQLQAMLKVVLDYSPDKKPMITLKDIAAHGSADDVLKYLESINLHNADLVNISSLAWICKESEQAFRAFIKVLKRQGIFNEKVWAYSMFHANEEIFGELIQKVASRFVQQYQYLKLPFEIKLQTFEPMEYDPLVNPRAHGLTISENFNFDAIRNTAFRETYARFLAYCAEKPFLDQQDRVALIAYWVAMDRVSEALVLMRRWKKDFASLGGCTSIQFDYLCAYLSMYEESPVFGTARRLCETYAAYPDLSWRERFAEIRHQLDEYFKGQIIEKKPEDDNKIRLKLNRELAEKSEYLQIEKTEDQGTISIKVTHRNIDRLTVKYFKFDMELLFSKDPFLENQAGGVNSVTPNFETKFRVVKADAFKTSSIKIPEHLVKENLIVQVSSRDKTASVEIYSSSLRLFPSEDFGQMRVTDSENNDLHTSYVKCYAKFKPESAFAGVRFHKDGYTDFRGVFDYCSTNSSGEQLPTIEKFALLISHPHHGAAIMTVKPPQQLARLQTKEEEEKSRTYREVYDTYHLEAQQTGDLN
jgi:hypothetical protein